MAVADATAYDAAMKEVWTGDNLEKQFYTEHPTLDQIERRTPQYEIGDKAVTPVMTERAGGYSAVPRTGSTNLNTADAVGMQQATWNYAHHVKQIKIESATIDETRGSSKAVAEAVNTEVEAALDTLRTQVTRQIYGNGDALIAQCTTTTTANEVELLSTGFGYDAIVRGWLHEGQEVDIGTTANEVAVADKVTITAVEENASTPSITINGSTVSTTSSHYVSIANGRSGTTSYETNGFRNMFGSTSAVLGGLDPATVTKWKPAVVDSSATSLTLPLLYNQRRQIFQRTRKNPDWCLTSPKQNEAAYKLAQPQVRFSGDGDIGVGAVNGWSLNNMKVEEDPDCPDRCWFTLSKKNLFAVRTKKPHWQNEYTGDSKILEWNQGTTALVAALFYRFQLGTDRRNAHGSLVGLTD